MFARLGASAKGVVRRFMHNPSQSYWNAIKHVLGYLVRTKDHNILFVLNKTAGIVGYTDLYFVAGLEISCGLWDSSLGLHGHNVEY